MITFPNAKINIGLNVVEKRADGYHNLETIFYPIPVKDALEFVPSSSDGKTTFHQSGITIDGDAESNLIMKALRLLEKDFSIPQLDIYLEKAIPFGAGLGGGSSDAAFMLKMLNKEFNLKLSNSKLESYASKLGADCPFFIENKTVFASGIGNVFEPIEFSLKGMQIVLIKPDIHVSTPLAYSMVTPRPADYPVKEWIKRPIDEWKGKIVNDFEISVFPKFPEIERIKNSLYEKGALYASMSGSGSSVFGIFENVSEDILRSYSEHYTFLGTLE
ncbi:MAG TPA: 4-(cytidine 5'-diphospho)-2-C-methyl-D-erythritol kinase [Candidatus Gracilibacteria bacterium]|nr:4-(cytidine 5'-diphospho)-2-C-methyl-D-erythritol kinase [Candidatus Gracilibacteria bacterium]